MLEDKLKLLNYDKIWLDNEILTEKLLLAQVLEFKNGEDKNAEHYRYSTFKSYLTAQQILSDTIISRLFDIIKVEVDTAMAKSMAIEILKTKSLSESQFEFVCEKLKLTFSEDMQVHIDREKYWRTKRQN